jgi:glycosyl transferase family 25
MKIFVTNLKGFDERKKWIQKHFQQHSLDFEFIDCFDGRKWDDEDIKKVVSPSFFDYHKRKESWVTKGAIAATLTHVEKIYKRMIEDNIDYALCCEDDIELCYDFKGKLFEIEKHLIASNFDGVLLLHYHLNQKTKINELDFQQINTQLKIYYLPQNLNVGSGAGYIISKNTAKLIIESQSPIERIADCWNGHPNVQTHFIYPMLIFTGVFSSTLGYENYKYAFLFKLLPNFIKRKLRMNNLRKLEKQNIHE